MMPQYIYEYHFLKSLLLTVSIEFSVLFIFVRYYMQRTYPLKTLLFTGIFPSFATLPYAWFIFPLLFPNSHTEYVYFTESTVTVIESFMIALLLKLPIKQGFALSFAANMSSFLIGWVFWSL